jgi:hypothetical protein
MRMIVFAVIGAGAMTAAALGLAGTAAAAGGADAIINGLSAEGFSVQLNGSQTANLSACAVTDIKKDGAPGSNPTAYVDVSCPDGC